MAKHNTTQSKVSLVKAPAPVAPAFDPAALTAEQEEAVFARLLAKRGVGAIKASVLGVETAFRDQAKLTLETANSNLIKFMESEEGKPLAAITKALQRVANLEAAINEAKAVVERIKDTATPEAKAKLNSLTATINEATAAFKSYGGEEVKVKTLRVRSEGSGKAASNVGYRIADKFREVAEDGGGVEELREALRQYKADGAVTNGGVEQLASGARFKDGPYSGRSAWSVAIANDTGN